MFTCIKDNIKSVDSFAMRVSLNHNGEYRYRTFCGGIVSIFTLSILIVYGALKMYSLYYDPVYNQIPPVLDYAANKTIEMPWEKNMVSYRIRGPSSNPAETLRVLFYDQVEIIPAVYCSDYYADEIAAE